MNKRWQRGRRLGMAIAVCLLLGAGGASQAPASSGAVLDQAPGLGNWQAPPALFERSLLDREAMHPTSVGRIDRSTWWGGPVVTSTGETVTLYLSDRFPPDEAARLSWANFFASLYHGSELSTVTIYQAPLDEVGEICGSEAAGCYSPSRHVLVFPGDVGQGADADVGAHEYGHHVAASRRNDPWDPNDWGPKRWGTAVGVCSRVASGTAYPGDEGDHYTLNPGEAFAEAYRILNIQRGGTWANLPLIVDSSFMPTADSLAAALGDVQQPWSTPAQTSWDGQFAAPVVNLSATVGPRATISMKTAGGAPLRRLTVGPVAITVRDVSAKDNFHLSGPALERKTGVPGRGRVQWRVVLKPGTYRYRSDAHPQLKGSFTVAGTNPATFAPQEKTIPTLLDGTFEAVPSGTANVTVELIDPVSGQDLVGATTGSVASTVCGRRAVLLRVSANRPGTFHVSIGTP
jgi:hypothetical protein